MNTIKASEIKGVIPEGATHYIDDDGVNRFYIKHTDGYLLVGRNGVKIPCDNIDSYFKESITEIIYDTEFVPEVGMECEVFAGNDVRFVGEGASLIGLKVYVNAVFEKKNGIKMAAIEPASTNNGSSDVVVVSCLRPIKSEEDKLRDWLKGQQPTTDRSDIKAKLNQYTYNLIKAGVKIPEGEQ